MTFSLVTYHSLGLLLQQLPIGLLHHQCIFFHQRAFAHDAPAGLGVDERAEEFFVFQVGLFQ